MTNQYFFHKTLAICWNIFGLLKRIYLEGGNSFILVKTSSLQLITNFNGECLVLETLLFIDIVISIDTMHSPCLLSLV